jgi:hypothetical protein
MKSSKKLLCGFLFTVFFSLNYSGTLLCAEQKAPSKTVRTIKDISLTYALLMCVAAAHEAGHALAIKALYGESCAINVGSNWTQSKTFYDGGSFTLKYPLMPVGYVQFYSYGKSPLKDIAICLSGPVWGSAASYIYLKILKKIYPNEDDYRFAKGCMQTSVWAQYLNLLPLPGYDGDHALSSLQKLL